MARTKRVSKARKGRRVRSKRVSKKRTKRSSKSSSRSNKRMRRSFIKKSRGRSRRSLRRMRGGASAAMDAGLVRSRQRRTTRPKTWAWRWGDGKFYRVWSMYYSKDKIVEVLKTRRENIPVELYSTAKNRTHKFDNPAGAIKWLLEETDQPEVLGTQTDPLPKPKKGMFKIKSRDNSRDLDVSMLETAPKMTKEEREEQEDGAFEVGMVSAGSEPVGLDYNPPTDATGEFNLLKDLFNTAYDEARELKPKASEDKLYEMAKSNQDYVTAKKKYLYPNSM